MKPQYGDDTPRPFSFSTGRLELRQVPCFITYTNEVTHQIINNNLDKSPLYGGIITGTGVRYCPSFEDKVVKFPHHPRHQIFLEPESLSDDQYYPNGLSTSLPEDVQDLFIRSVPGLEKVRINRYGYGIEHDVIDSTQILPTLESKSIEGLYAAGQICGTTGYEEAAALGLIAGVNASRSLKGQRPLILDRSSGYIGVLIDDLVTKGTDEPYRMFTSRVEYRLLLREDNADLRLRKTGYDIGLVSEEDFKKSERKRRDIEEVLRMARNEKIKIDGHTFDLETYLKRPETRIKDLAKRFAGAETDVLNRAETEIKYSGYIKRQLAEIRNFKNLERIKIPTELNYAGIPGLSREITEKLSGFRPINLGQAGRISGVTPAAVSILTVYLKKIS
jgi:tRNA uridine 5-carboxymethylaminomethyl modification enzyme